MWSDWTIKGGAIGPIEQIPSVTFSAPSLLFCSPSPMLCSPHRHSKRGSHRGESQEHSLTLLSGLSLELVNQLEALLASILQVPELERICVDRCGQGTDGGTALRL